MLTILGPPLTSSLIDHLTHMLLPRPSFSVCHTLTTICNCPVVYLFIIK